MNRSLEPETVNITRNGRPPTTAVLIESGLELEWEDGTKVTIPRSALIINGEEIALKSKQTEVEIHEPGKEPTTSSWSDSGLQLATDDLEFDENDPQFDFVVGVIDEQLLWRASWEDSPLPWEPLPKSVCPTFETREFDVLPIAPEDEEDFCPPAKD